MGTRGALGFHIDGRDKVMYNHSDSYPSWLGRKVADFIRETSDDELKQIAERIRLVSDDLPPTPEETVKYSKYGNENVGGQTLNEWYCLLRETQGDLTPYRDDCLDVMIDDSSFLLDSLFCEYAYIINVDDGVLEFYTGYNKKNGKGRYGAKKDVESGFYGVHLVETTPLNRIRERFDSPEEFAKYLEKVAEAA